MGSLNIITVSILPELMYKFNMIQNKIPKAFAIRGLKTNHIIFRFGRKNKHAGISREKI